MSDERMNESKEEKKKVYIHEFWRNEACGQTYHKVRTHLNWAEFNGFNGYEPFLVNREIKIMTSMNEKDEI